MKCNFFSEYVFPIPKYGKIADIYEIIVFF